MEYFKLISITGLAVELIGIILLFRNESFNIKEKIIAKRILPPLGYYLEAKDKSAKPKAQQVLKDESNHRASIRNNMPSKVSVRLKTAYGCLFLGFFFQCAGILLS